jgi:nucleotide-binding universal stress UspA family protein
MKGMPQPKKILVATAFQKESEAALEYAIRMAQIINADIILVHIIEQLSLIAENFMSKDLNRHIMDFAEQKILSFANRVLGKRSVHITPMVKKGKVYSVISQLAKEQDVEFILMGRTEKHDLVRNIFGTNTHHIVGESQVPVITTKSLDKSTGFKRILLPLDLTETTKEKISAAVHVARMFNSSITLMTVLQKNWVSREIEFSSKLSSIKEIIHNFGIESDYKIINKSGQKVSDLIIRESEECKADLIMVMTHDETEFRDYFIGTTALAVIRKSRLPVLSIIPGAEKIEILSSSILKSILDPVDIF